jgi:glucose/arabinose dehydrogenase
VETWSRQGKLTGQFGKAAMQAEGFAGCCNPIAVAVLPDGRVVTAEKGLVRVKVYRADGTFEALVATTPVLSRGATNLDLATTANGEVLVLDPRARAILTFSENTTSRPQGSQ